MKVVVTGGAGYVGVPLCKALLERGVDIDSFAPRISWIFNTYNKIFEEVAKYRAARKVWADLLRNRFKAKDPRSWRRCSEAPSP